MFKKVLIANRGEIARRVIRTLRRLGVTAVAVYSEVDAKALHVAEADLAMPLPGGPMAYLNGAAVIEAARVAGAQAIHPGYGFLSENARFAEEVRAAGLIWIGPPPECIDHMGDKINARNLAMSAGVPVAPGTEHPLFDLPSAIKAADDLGYPVIVKATLGGGGIGMGVAHSAEELGAVFDMAASRAARAFKSPAILLERYYPRARHIEVQILGLADGQVVALGERDCSVQRRHQKLVEESPAPNLSAELRSSMTDAAVRAARAIRYQNAGTVEFLLDPASSEFVFLEMNTRLQVEHPVTELVTGLDLVAEQLLVASGAAPGFDPAEPPKPAGHAIEFRVCAEDPRSFLPSGGPISEWVEPEGRRIRVDSGYAAGDTVTPYYDSLLAKLCAHGSTRAEAISLLRDAVDQFKVVGLRCNLEFFSTLLANDEFLSGCHDTDLVSRMRASSGQP
ncbi:acetyl/propionyl/methylcrotonyl-CoA carboxylase subunit alpha [Mycobacterium sp. NAZ190054]|uniref:acetyl-CoA carboxylase biotin carboxylase subunit n=1 Tax=Mycobacterium sp. NAZ190054 TaxID=1747766 RepID=UPI000792C7BE|nr:biotin carboxylase N-terminal domain-containing protein [Mycobacterium sp. NAZ190054]KWX58517.1 biotin carboxylase [Mycobacterium sp. NAZ190054]